MARNQLVITADGRMVLAMPERISADQVRAIRAAFDHWKVAQPPELLVVPEAEVVRVVDVELAVPEGEG